MQIWPKGLPVDPYKEPCEHALNTYNILYRKNVLPFYSHFSLSLSSFSKKKLFLNKNELNHTSHSGISLWNGVKIRLFSRWAHKQQVFLQKINELTHRNTLSNSSLMRCLCAPQKIYLKMMMWKRIYCALGRKSMYIDIANSRITI